MRSEVRATIDDCETGAKNAAAGGFDGVELQGAFDCLPHRFLVGSLPKKLNARSLAYLH